MASLPRLATGWDRDTIRPRARHSFIPLFHSCFHPNCFFGYQHGGWPRNSCTSGDKTPLGRTILNPTPPGAGISSHRKRNSEGRWPAAAGEQGGLIIRRDGDGPGTTRWGLLLILREGGGGVIIQLCGYITNNLL